MMSQGRSLLAAYKLGRSPLSLPDGKYHFLETYLPFQLYEGKPMIKSEEVCCTRGSGKSGSEVSRPEAGSQLTGSQGLQGLTN